MDIIPKVVNKVLLTLILSACRVLAAKIMKIKKANATGVMYLEQ